MRAPILLFGVCVIVAAGCGDAPQRVAAPDVSPRNASAAAMVAYDSDGDGQIAGSELRKAPAMVAALDRMDSNADGKLSVEEISGRVNSWQSTSVGRVAIACKVTLNGKPLEGATVKLQPETFLGAEMLPARGTTDAHGVASLSVASAPGGSNPLGVQYGLYTVQISKSVAGRESLPARYNSDTTLGCEVARDANLRTGGMLEFHLTSGK